MVFDLTNLYNGSEKVTDVESVLNNCSIAFNISDLSGEKVYIDNISVGRTSKSAVFGDINDDGDINSKDLALLRKSLLGVKCDANTVKSDVNRNGTVDITDLVRLKKFLS